MTNIPSARRRIVFAFFGATLSVYLLFLPGHFLTTPDEQINLRTTLSLLEGQRGAIPAFPAGFASKRGIDGKEYAQYGLGLPVAAASWMALGRMLYPGEELDFAAWMQQPPGTMEDQIPDIVDPDGYFFLKIWASVFTILISALTVVVLVDLLLLVGVQTQWTIICGLLYAFGTYQWQHGRTFFTEPLTALCLLAAFWALFQARQNGLWKWYLLAGFCWAYGVFTRPDTLVTGLAALWLLLIDPDKKESPIQIDWTRIIAFAAPWAVFGLVVLLYNQYRFDSFFSTGYEDQSEGVHFTTPVLVGLHGFFFTPGRSLFLYSPPLLFALFGLVPFWKRDRWLAGGVYLLVGSYLVVMSMWQNWAGGFDWGPRHIFQITPFVMLIGAAGLNDGAWFNTKWKSAALIALGAFAVVIQLLGIAIDPVETIRTFLMRYPEIQVAPGMPLASMLLQFNVYLPQFSSPVLHWNAIWNGQASSLWPIILQNELYMAACIRAAFVAVAALLIAGILAFRANRKNA
ncbi:MAG: glycosyltransferase family 39 protein [Candidatus Hinthialibacter antarcticus]|nr:glycosyltransferase family 39 protein [Candidatus Hinthialibacter antarcticus]